MKKVLCIFLMICYVFTASFVFAANEESAFTQVAYNGTGTSYYELDVPAKMAPGDTGTVSLSGTWEASRVIKVSSDWEVVMKNSTDDEEIYLEIYFDGIDAPGNNVNPISVSKSVDIDFMDYILFGTWNGVFNYYVDVLDSQVNNGSEHSGVIPYGGTYYVMATGEDFETWEGDYSLAQETYVAGDEFPEDVCDGDVYVYGEYEYRYNYAYEDPWFSYDCGGWCARVLDISKSSYESVLSSINGKDVNNMTGTYRDCTKLKYSPTIPTSVTELDFAFYNCSSLLEAPTIHNGVTSLGYTFRDCVLIEVAPNIPSSTINMNSTFDGCRALKVAPVIPENVKYMNVVLGGCEQLTGALEVNAKNPTAYLYALFGTNITEITGTASDELKEALLATKYME